ncbi:Glycosyl transferase family 2 [Roseovarius nanhaiticus]|uniref:Glycosyl transferase family 2 n=1 Tax=Roseovarius nanhaiticus TaxID=573024 RepID=A0A1N7HNQ5_9RHOB|nr:glycosyltransferase family 2 protein [Roseovarius nanhaiticus]SEL38392.1 Glycosyl transferase family 2 [Roseovarius nanhaiticus]SIS26443.1 Glycosyl transferase family 2 [Roseovarius nanhaiticus]
MTCPAAKDTAIIIPARNEEARIGGCLTALAEQGNATVILVVNNTTDRTGSVARDTAARRNLDLTVLERTLPAQEGVGTARRIGCDHALQTMPALRYLLTTDADCIVAPDWIARNLAHLKTADAVCGKVDLIEDEADILDGMDPHLAELEGTYRALVQDIYARHAPECSDIGSTHGEAAGASLAFTRTAYLDVGGFAPIRCGEDRRIVRALRAAGCRVRHADDVKVQASCRLTGRAAGGMSDALKARIGGMDYLIDDCLPSADWLVRQAIGNTLGPWPPQVPGRYRLNVRELSQHIEILEKFRNSERLISAPIASAATMPCSHLDTLLPGNGSANVPAGPDTRGCPVRVDRLPDHTQTSASAPPTVKGA